MDGEQQTEQIIIAIIKRILGLPSKNIPGQKEYEFNCPQPLCRQDHNKYNLWFNSEKNIFRCWKCTYRGTAHKIVDDYGTPEERQTIRLFIPITRIKQNKNTESELINENIVCKLPYGFKKLEWVQKTENYRKAIEYLTKRGIDMNLIQKYNIGYTEEKFMKGRIIIPSYNIDGDVNYYVGRAFLPNIKPPYMGLSSKKVPKDKIIFNESNVNFDLPIYIVEGVFDMFPLYNAIPILGKFPSKPLISKLIKHQTRTILCLDEDAIMDSVELYHKLSSYGLDVYFVEIPGDVAECYQQKGKEYVYSLLKKQKKIDFKYIMQLSMKDKKINENKIDSAILEEAWKKLQEEFQKNL